MARESDLLTHWQWIRGGIMKQNVKLEWGKAIL